MGRPLGQHFLKSRAVAELMAKTSGAKPGGVVLEIGPGKGVLTEEVLKTGASVVAVEKDKKMVELLKERFMDERKDKKLILIHEDILNFDPKDHELLSKNYSLVGNIPYYITGAIMKTVLSFNPPPKTVVLMIQKEVANRIVAKGGKESVLSISVKAYGVPKYIKTVKSSLFAPPPKVDSAIIQVENISRDFFYKLDKKSFFELVKTGFAHKRKFLAGNLSKYGREEVEKFLKKEKISPKARAENLKIDDWRKLSTFLGLNT